jgi:RNA polymerase sigma factor (sigma-70 family)
VDYIGHRDDAAFAALVRRHGPMVWGVCRRVLCNHEDAEDAFQATFLVLVRKAASISSRELLANWLYGVAHQTAMKARATAAKRKGREKQVTDMPEPAVIQQEQWRDLQPLLDEELSRLPDKYRGVLILCDLEGRTRKEVAGQLGCAEGTVASRLARARIMLAKRLTRRGVALSSGALAAVLSQQAVSADVPSSVVHSTIKAASLLAAGKAAGAGAISLKVVALTEGLIKAMFLTKLKTAAAGLLLTVAALGGAAGMIFHTQAAEQPRCFPADDEPASHWQLGLLTRQNPKDQQKQAKAAMSLSVELLANKDTKVASVKATISAIEGIKGVKASVSFGVQEAKGISARIHPSPELPYGKLFEVMEALKKAGVGKITIVTQEGDGSGQKTTTGKENKTSIAWGKEIDGLQAGIRLRAIDVLNAANRWEALPPVGTIHQGSVLRFEVVVRNVSKQEVRLKYIQPCGWPCAEDGRDLKFCPAYSGGIPIGYERTLKPGEDWEVAQLNIATRKPKPTESFSGVRLLELGKFRVSCPSVLMQEKKGRVATGEVEIEIVPPKVKSRAK